MPSNLVVIKVVALLLELPYQQQCFGSQDSSTLFHRRIAEFIFLGLFCIHKALKFMFRVHGKLVDSSYFIDNESIVEKCGRAEILFFRKGNAHKKMFVRCDLG